MRIPRRLFLISAAAVLSACASTQSAQERQQRNEPTILSVDNQALLDMTIYVLRGAERIRLGVAGGLRVTNLPIPSNLIFGATGLRFLADPIGSNRTPVSEEITVSPGDQIRLTIPPA